MSGLRDKLIVALDRPDLASAMAQVDRIGDAVAWYKVGLELFYAAGRPSIQALADRGKRFTTFPRRWERRSGRSRGFRSRS